VIQSFPNFSASPLTREYLTVPTIILPLGAGAERRLSLGINTRQEWRVIFADYEIDDIHHIDQFLKDKNGVTRFLWSPPARQTEITVICAQWHIDYMAANLATLRAIFIKAVPVQTTRASTALETS
jgi:phage-related protein